MSTGASSDANEAFFKYTSGRWLYGEKRRLQERYLEFDVSALKRIAAEAVDRETCVRMEKIAEGGYNRIFCLTMEDGFEVIARFPYPSTVPAFYATASEIATLRFLQTIDIPVPHVYAWKSTTSPETNPVGAEFIIMEKLQGEELTKSWPTMTSLQRLEIAQHIVEIERKVFSYAFPRFGSLYLKDDVPGTPSDEVFDGFVVGPTVDQSAWHDERTSMELDRGPWKTAESYLKAIAHIGIESAKHHGQPRYPNLRFTETPPVYPQEHINLLRKYEKVIPSILRQEASRCLPKLRHPDLHPRNILIKPGSTEIVGIIDWQHAYIAPFFLLAGICPMFRRADGAVPTSFKIPTLPDNYSQLSADEKEDADELYRQQMTLLAYLFFTHRDVREHWDAFNSLHSFTRQNVVEQAAAPCLGDVSALRAALITIVDDWKEIAPGDGPCPIEFSDEERELHAKRALETEGLSQFVSTLSAIMGIGRDGWVTHEGFDDAVKEHERLKELWRASAEESETEEVKNEALQWWPFRDAKET
ncbi:hypothetical protein BOTBODRAFT_163507, partial [Botryobasidium botryosum FD-172 SS1]